jgi:hypothetical protein
MSSQSFPLSVTHIPDRDLLLWIDRELTGPRAADIQDHLSACPACRTRAAEIEHSITDFKHLYAAELHRDLPSVDGPRSLLKARLAERASSSRIEIRNLIAAAGVAVFLVLAGVAIGTRANSRETYLTAIPNVYLTPGATSPVSTQDVCSGNIPTNDPAVPDPLKQQVLKEYGLQDLSSNSYEIDYLVTPQLGGAVNIRNLWPEPVLKTVWNSRVKDKLEDRLHSLVCSGQLDLPTAQRELSRDWVAAYKKYFGTTDPRAISMLLAPSYFNACYFNGTNKIRCSVASSTAFRENGSG